VNLLARVSGRVSHLSENRPVEFVLRERPLRLMLRHLDAPGLLGIQAEDERRDLAQVRLSECRVLPQATLNFLSNRERTRRNVSATSAPRTHGRLDFGSHKPRRSRSAR